jgi:class 3 adenylate cyclase/tetratricopeptide (TPR) repeat protein
MTEVARWLREIGLTRYVDLFHRRSIDFESLKTFSEQDLEELGLPPAPSRLIRREIDLLAAAPAAAVAESLPLPPDTAERRQLTIMFCDLVNSVPLSTRLDPEDLRDVIAAYHQTCTQSVRRYNGFVARYMGDGMLIYFGYPAAHEDDAERAVRAGLEIVDAVAKLNNSMDPFTDLNLRVRVGVATGLVVVGDEIAENVSDKDSIAGEAVNLAARLQTLAAPNTVVASVATRQLAAERFEYIDLGFQEIKGFDTPVPVYQVIGEREISRLAARNAALTPFVGRDQEIELILDRWARATSCDGQVVIVAGEAGIGKSRIAAEAASRIRRSDPDTPSPLLFQCSPYHTNAPLFPVIKELERVAEIRQSQLEPEKLDRLRTLLRVDGGDDDRRLLLIADLLDLDVNEHLPPIAVSAMVKRSLTIEALKDWVASCAREKPLIIVFEDVQWIDPTSRLLLNLLVDWAKTARALIVITLRIESPGAERWCEEAGLSALGSERRSHVSLREIGELGEVEATRLAAAAAGETIPEHQLIAIVTKSDGIPLYLEELVRAVVNNSALSENHEDIDQTDAVPNTLRDALMAQLDRLGRAKEVAQHAAVIGQEFSISLLAKVTNKPIGDLSPKLHSLIDSKIIVESGRTSEIYRFKHALLRDISYRSLLRKVRRQIHRRVASELADRKIETVDATDDLIAQHYSRGQSYSEAIQFWQRGASAAIARSAHEEAVGMLEAALMDFRKLRRSDALALELELVLARAMSLRSLRGYSAPEVEEGLIKARELCTLCADTSSRFNVEWGLFQCTIVKGDIAGARHIAAALFEHAERHPERPIVDAYLANGMVAFHLGDFEGAMGFFEKGVSVSCPETDQPHFFTHGQNPGLFCLSYLARTQCFLGYLDRGRATISRGLAIAANRADDPGHIYGHVNALIHAVRVYHLCGDLDAEKRLSQETLSLAQRNHFAYYEALSSCHLGWVVGAEGSLSLGIEKMLRGLTALGQTSTELGLPGFYVRLAELYIRAGQPAQAAEALQKAVGLEGFGTRAFDAEVERVRGDISASLAQPDLSAAELAYRSSLAIARHQRASLFLFKAGLSLARLLQRVGRHREGYEILNRCLEELPVGSDTQHVRDARLAMNELAGDRVP